MCVPFKVCAIRMCCSCLIWCIVWVMPSSGGLYGMAWLNRYMVHDDVKNGAEHAVYVHIAVYIYTVCCMLRSYALHVVFNDV